MQFTELGLHADILRAISEQGFTTPTTIQQQAIPAVMTGKDLMDRGLAPGPQFKRLLDQVRDAQLNGEVVTRTEALNRLNQLIEL